MTGTFTKLMLKKGANEEDVSLISGYEHVSWSKQVFRGPCVAGNSTRDSHTSHIYLSTGPSCTTHSACSGIWGDVLVCVVHLLVSHAVRPRDTSLHLVHTGGKGGHWTLPSLVMLVCSRAGL